MGRELLSTDATPDTFCHHRGSWAVTWAAIFGPFASRIANIIKFAGSGRSCGKGHGVNTPYRPQEFPAKIFGLRDLRRLCFPASLWTAFWLISKL
jgi:hypothetical protein